MKRWLKRRLRISSPTLSMTKKQVQQMNDTYARLPAQVSTEWSAADLLLADLATHPPEHRLDASGHCTTCDKLPEEL